MVGRAFEEAQTMGSNLAGKDFAPRVDDFDHTGFDFSPTEGYLDHKVDFVHSWLILTYHRPLITIRRIKIM